MFLYGLNLKLEEVEKWDENAAGLTWDKVEDGKEVQSPAAGLFKF